MFKKRLIVCLLSACLTMAMSTSVFGVEILENNHFSNGVSLPWIQVENAPAHAEWSVANNKYNMKVVNNGIDKWDVQFCYGNLTIEQDHTYTVEFTIESPEDCKVYAKIGKKGGDYSEYWHNNANPWEPYNIKAGVPLIVKETFTMKKATDKTCELAFHVAGSLYVGFLPHNISFSNIHLDDPKYPTPQPQPEDPTNAIRVNQIGYAPNLEKVATLVSASTTPVVWSLKNSAGIVVKTGTTAVKGFDHASGDNVHLIDFSSYQVKGKGYTLSVPTSAVDITLKNTTTLEPNVSMPFDIDTDLYTTMKYDAIKYFYHSRSGVPILEKYVQRPDLARPAGHDPDVVVTNKTSVGAWYTPSYSKDLTGGWYDAGDNGKYVVNGGITTWTMYNQYERALIKGNTKVAPIVDGSMNIPESGNNIPDILDEARFNTELLLKMQVTPSESTEYAGMVHHKARDIVWTQTAIRPDQDKLGRMLDAPTTAATLNMAAVAAQASRLWKQYDAAFATKCITAASYAWDAAILHPAIYAPMVQGIAGCGYNSENFEDEFYWAACELFVTTGDSKYLTYIKSSPKYLVMPTTLTSQEDDLSGAFDSVNVTGLGTISLALVSSQLAPADVAIAKANISKAADVFIATENGEGYGSPIKEDPITGYAWASNSIAINQAIVMGYAYEFTQNPKYLNGAATVMDYLLGRNPNIKSYVTGYGDNPLENPNHRFWAYQVNDSFPKPPAGVLSAGPNSGLQDPWVKGAGWKPYVRPAQKCFIDNFQSWSTNEVSMVFNASLAWMTSFMDEKIMPKPLGDVYGDVNGDGKVNKADYDFVKSYIMGKMTTSTGTNKIMLADVNRDGEINITDYILINKYILGKITIFPIK